MLLRGLKQQFEHWNQLTAVVTVADDGGSSGRLRRDYGVLPPGDIRNCIVALADDEHLLAQLFQYRFPSGSGLSGHSFGNLFLTALTGITGDFYQAILTAESILAVRGRILPSTLHDVRLRGVGEGGQVYEGESAIGNSGERLETLELDPPQVAAFPPAVEALENAQVILLGPGSLYTSILPNLLIPGIRDAIRRSRARVVCILNLMTQPGETDQMNALDHLIAIEKHAGEALVDVVLANSTQPAARQLRPYSETGSKWIEIDDQALAERRAKVFSADLLAQEDLIRHDPAKLSRAVMAIAHAI